MFEILPESKASLLAVKASGKLSAEDYEKILLPKLDDMFKIHEKVNMLVEFADDFSGWSSPTAAWDDAKIGLQHIGDFDKLALVGAPHWVTWSTQFFSVFFPGEIKQFSEGKVAEALSWLIEKPQG